MENTKLMIYDNKYYAIHKLSHKLSDHDYVSAAFLTREAAEEFVEQCRGYGCYVVMSADEAKEHYQVIL